MRFFSKLTRLLMAPMSIGQLLLAVPEGLADQPTFYANPSPVKSDAGSNIQGNPTKIKTHDLVLLQDKLGELKSQLLSFQQQPFRQLLKDPLAGRGRIEIHLLIEDAATVPEKIQLAWDNQPITTIEYNNARQAALIQGGADRLMDLETNPGVHTLGVHYTRSDDPKDHHLSMTTISVQKKNAIMVLLLKPKNLKKGIDLEYEALEGPIHERKERWLQLWLQNAIFHYSMGQFEEAAVLLLTCLEARPSPPRRAELLLWLGKTYLGWGLEGKAAAILQQTLQEFPSVDRVLPEAWYYLQKAHYRQGQYEAATADYARMGRRFLPAALSEIHYTTGQSFLYLKDYVKAISALSQVPKTSSYYPYALYALGLAYLGMGDTYAAQQSFNKLIGLDLPSDPKEVSHTAGLIEKGLVTLGLMMIEQNRYQEAISILGTVPTRSRFFGQALFGMGWSYMKLEEYVKAIVAYKDLTEKLPESPYTFEARVMMGYSYSKLKAYTKAVDSFRQALEASSQQVTSLTQQMDTVKQRGIDLNQAGSPLWYKPAEASDKIREAVEDYRELSRLSSKDLPQPPDPDFRTQFKELGQQLSVVLKNLTLQSLQSQRARLEDLSIQASIGIAKNLALEKTEFGGEELVLE